MPERRKIRAAWLHALRPQGRLIFPLTIGADPNAHRDGIYDQSETRRVRVFAVRFVSTVMIFPCIGSRDEESNQRLLEAVKRGTWGSVRSVRVDAYTRQVIICWLHSDGACLSNVPT